MEPANENGEYWPPPEEREAERRRLDRLRPWHRAIFVVLLLALLAVVGVFVWDSIRFNANYEALERGSGT